MRDYENDNGTMMFGGMSAVDIADRFGTPVYVTDEQILRQNYRNIYGAFAQYMPTEIHYACKANTNLAILSILNQEGSHIDAVSIGEVLTCLKAGFPAERIMYTGVNVSNSELEQVVATGCRINVDSQSELERLAKITTDIPISFRITPGVSSGHSAKVMTGGKGAKFGIPMDKVIETYARAKDLGFELKGIHAHTGSGGLTVEPFMDVVDVLCETVNDIKSEVGVQLEFLDFGGGVGVPYKPQDPEADLNELAMVITDTIKDETDIKTVALEPGRYVVCDSTILLTRCVDVKDAGIKKYIGVDAGFNTLIRPAFYDSYHYVAIANKFNKAGVAKYEIVGPICETGDYIAHDRALPEAEEGDVIAVYCGGAYGFAMSSNYNSRPRCAEVLVNQGEAELIREKEDIEDLWRHQIIPARLSE
ncbi:MAG: diaminopimelate decarboxylase [Candidatus Methanomethylophilaceae archaeon]|nr:diaminopimelate decarboxylase [Candidatus Methanomethylophilaceae archaeon]MDY5871895.1 diaminopimelate decarboxylase [Candidatus Methanomethylophilaceae archaeon]